MSTNFQKSMNENGIVNEEKLSTDKIQEIFAPLKLKVEQSLKNQEILMAEVELWNKRFSEEKSVTGGMDRENLLKRLAASYDTFFELENNLAEGMKVSTQYNNQEI